MRGGGRHGGVRRGGRDGRRHSGSGRCGGRRRGSDFCSAAAAREKQKIQNFMNELKNEKIAKNFEKIEKHH